MASMVLHSSNIMSSYVDRCNIYIYIYTHTHVYNVYVCISISLSLYIYIYTYTYVHTYYGWVLVVRSPSFGRGG